MAAEPNAREIARRLMDEVLDERSERRPTVVPPRGDGMEPGAASPGVTPPGVVPSVATPAVDPAARSAARRLVDEVLRSHGVRIGARGAEQQPSTGPSGDHAAAGGATPPTADPPTSGRGVEPHSPRRVDPEATRAARRIVDEVLRDHERRDVHQPVDDEVASGPPPAPTREERARRETATRADATPVAHAVLITDARADVDPAVAARRIVDDVLAAHAPTPAAPAVVPEVDSASADESALPDDDPIPEELFAPTPPELFAPTPPEQVGPGPDGAAEDAAEPVVVDVTDDTGPDVGPETEATRTAARIVADVLAARALAAPVDGADVEDSPGDQRATRVVTEVDTRRIDVDDEPTVVAAVDDEPTGPAVVDDASPDGDVLLEPDDADDADDAGDDVWLEPDAAEDVWLEPDAADDSVWPEPDIADDDVWLESDADDDWSAVVPSSSYQEAAAVTTELEPDEWPQPSAPRRTGRWLLTTVLGAIALAYLFPLAVQAVLDLVALS